MTDGKILIAGATGYLGQHLVAEAKRRGYWVRALTRNTSRLEHLRNSIDDMFVGEVTDAGSIADVCRDIDFVVSAVGITRQKDGLTYMDVDYGGNKNLLDLALAARVKKFAYVSVFGAHLMPKLRIIQAKERFARELSDSSLDSVIIRPTGFYSDMLEILTMAKKGRVNLFGDGEYRINPIHGQDLAEVCLDALSRPDSEVEAGGPETYTHNQIAAMAFEVVGKKPKISYMPIWVKDATLSVMRLFMSSKSYGPIEFVWSALSMDGVAPSYGSHKLREFYEENA